MVDFWVAMLCGFVGGNTVTEEHTASIFQIQPRQNVALKCWYPPTCPNDVTTQKTTDIFTTMRTSNLCTLVFGRYLI
jgi:hypothetical protein